MQITGTSFDLPVVNDGIPCCTLVTPLPCEPKADALRRLREAVREELARDLPVVPHLAEVSTPGAVLFLLCLDEQGGGMPEGLRGALSGIRLPEGQESFAIGMVEAPGGLHVLVLKAREPAGLSYAAQHIVDSCWASEGRSLRLQGVAVAASPDLAFRGAYTLTCWGNAAKNTAAGWRGVADVFAEATINRMLFWVSGLLRPESLPQAFCGAMRRSTLRTDPAPHADYLWGYAGTDLGEEELRDLAAHAARRHLSLYPATGLFEWHYTYGALEDEAVRPRCPSSPAAREYATRYVEAILSALGEVPGLLLEVRGEDGGCRCGECSRVVDGDGSRQFGQALGRYLAELLELIWSRMPRCEVVVTVGYRNDATDSGYLELLQRLRDPRLVFWICRPQPDGMPARGGRRVHPGHYFQRRLTWIPANRLSFEDILTQVRQAKLEGMLGALSECDPGFYQTVNLWHDFDLPYDGSELCFRVKQFAFGRAVWNAHTTMEELRAALHRKFFGPSEPPEAVDILVRVVEAVRRVSDAYFARFWILGRGDGSFEGWLRDRPPEQLRRLRDQLKSRREFWCGLPALLSEAEEQVRLLQPGRSRRSARTLRALEGLLLDLRSPLVGPERWLVPRVAGNGERTIPVIALRDEGEQWIRRIDELLASGNMPA